MTPRRTYAVLRLPEARLVEFATEIGGGPSLSADAAGSTFQRAAGIASPQRGQGRVAPVGGAVRHGNTALQKGQTEASWLMVPFAQATASNRRGNCLRGASGQT